MKNKFEVRDDVTAVFIEMKSGLILEALIETNDLPLVIQFPNTWSAKYDMRRNCYYVQGHLPTDSKRKRGYTALHRWIMGDPVGLMIDHINRNTLDNRRVNLRAVTAEGNNQNVKVRRDNKTGYRGVTTHARGGFIAKLKVMGKEIYLGKYSTPEEANETVTSARSVYHPHSQDAELQINKAPILGLNRKNPIRKIASGHRNVYWNERSQHWRVQFVSNRKLIHYSSYNDLSEAINKAIEVRESLSRSL